MEKHDEKYWRQLRVRMFVCYVLRRRSVYVKSSILKRSGAWKVTPNDPKMTSRSVKKTSWNFQSFWEQKKWENTCFERYLGHYWRLCGRYWKVCWEDCWRVCSSFFRGNITYENLYKNMISYQVYYKSLLFHFFPSGADCIERVVAFLAVNVLIVLVMTLHRDFVLTR